MDESPTPPAGFVVVDEQEFFAKIGPIDVHPSARMPFFTTWEMRDRRVIGWSFPGWKNPGALPKVWALAKPARG